MAKELNIPVKAEGVEKAKQGIDEFTRSIEQLGEKTEQAGKKQSDGINKASQSISSQQGLVRELTGKLAGMFGVWKGIELVVQMLDKMTDRLKNIRDLHREIASSSLSIMEAGQRLEIQEGTVGKQGDWSKFLAGLQKDARLSSPNDALELSTAFSIATASTGGLKNVGNQELIRKIAPMFGAADLSGAQGAGFIKYAGMAGIAPTEDAYRDFFAKTMTAFRSSQSTDFGQFITGLQSGTTAMIKQGATPDAALSVYATALSVTKNEAAAATLTEQMSRLSSGAYEKPRQALEKFGGYKWNELNADEQMGALLYYVNSIPENERIQRLTDEGFSPELATGLSKIASPDSLKLLHETRKNIAESSGVNVQRQVDAFKDSPVGKERERLGKKAEDTLGIHDRIGGWQERLKAAEDYVNNLAAEGKDALMTPNDTEAGIYAYQSIINELDLIIQGAESSGDKEISWKARQLKIKIQQNQSKMWWHPRDEFPGAKRINDYRRQKAFNEGPEIEQELGELRQRSGVVINNYNNYDYSSNIHRIDPGASPRTDGY